MAANEPVVDLAGVAQRGRQPLDEARDVGSLPPQPEVFLLVGVGSRATPAPWTYFQMTDGTLIAAAKAVIAATVPMPNPPM